MASFLEGLPFEPDPFQIQAVAAIERGHGVVVTAPTGAGKTVIAEAAVDLALNGGGRAFYTTPIKALSNQKFTDLVERYGEAEVGLLTGDNSINDRAPIIVMTTEVLRNMIHARSAALKGLRIVVLDEVHYLGDRSRGGVWEEVIIHAPPTTQLVCLSATIANPEELTEWIRSRRGDVELIVEEHRPVPLEARYALKDRWHDDKVEILPLFRGQGANRAIQQRLASRTGNARRGGRPPRRFVTPRRLELFSALRTERMLPAIYFIFSRKGCEQAAAAVGERAQRQADARLSLIHEVAERHTRNLRPADLAVLEYGQWVSRLERGVAAHHAGMVPAFKEAVEELFERGLLDVVFATETLAVGINMPARSVVLESLTKFTGEVHEMMTPSDYTQLTGRAGRRGIDEVGYGVVLHSPYVRFDKVVRLAEAGASPLMSSFRPTYNMAVNLVANYDQDRAEELLGASLAQFQREKRGRAEADRVTAIRTELTQIAEQAECSKGSAADYLASRAGVRVDTAVLDELRPGDVVDVPGGRRPGRYVLLKREFGDTPRLRVLSAGGKEATLGLKDLAPGSAVLGSISWEGPFRPRDRRFRQQTVQALKRFRPREHRILGSTPTEAAHPLDECPRREEHLKAAKRIRRLEERLERLGAPAHASLVDEFGSVLAILRGRGYLHDWVLDEPGDRLRRIYSEQDLLIAECLRQGLFERCDPAELAAVLSAFVFEPRADDVPDAHPTRATEVIAGEVLDLWRGLVAEERSLRLEPTRPPEFGFAASAYAWCQGASLDEIEHGLPGSPGDFVRVTRQLLDVTRQVRDAEPSLRSTASEVLRSIDRGIVTTGGQE